MTENIMIPYKLMTKQILLSKKKTNKFKFCIQLSNANKNKSFIVI